MRRVLPIVGVLLLAAGLLAYGSYLSTQEWTWDPVTTNAAGDPLTKPVTEYRMYTAMSPTDCFGNYLVIPAVEPYCDGVRCGDRGDLDGVGWQYMVITAVNEDGESSLGAAGREPCP